MVSYKGDLYKLLLVQVTAAPVLSISSDLSVESVRSSFPRVILIDSISVEVLVAPEVGATAFASPAGVLELVTHSSSEADLSESSLPPVSVAPMVSPFLCSNDSESDNEMPKRHVSSIPHDAMLTRIYLKSAITHLNLNDHSLYLKMILENVNNNVGELVGLKETQSLCKYLKQLDNYAI
ncbi:hypothetical protein Tco_0134865 [Tanacetum coccineum]